MFANLAAHGIAVAPPALAAVDCVHRGEAHIERHGGLAEDNRWHIAHGELPTCDPHKKSEHRCDETEDIAHEPACDERQELHDLHHYREGEPHEDHWHDHWHPHDEHRLTHDFEHDLEHEL